jgi:hypothetical protein
MITSRHEHDEVLGLESIPAWALLWHLKRVIFPRSSIAGHLLWGTVWRRHDGRRWIYKKYVEAETKKSPIS